MHTFFVSLKLYFEEWSRIRKTPSWWKGFLKHPDPTENGLAFWREKILFAVLVAGTGLSLIALIPAIYMTFNEGFWLLLVLDILAFLAMTYLLVQQRVTFYQKTVGIVLITFVVGVSIIFNAGFVSAGTAWLFCFAVLSGVLLGIKAAVFALALNAAALFVLGWWFAPSGYLYAIQAVTHTRALTAWANFLFLNAVTAISVAVLVNGLQALNKETNAATDALKEERADLLRTREQLKQEIEVRIKSERALHQSEQKYRLLAENIQDVIWMMDMAFKFTYVSPSIERLQGWLPEEFLELPLKHVISPSSFAKVSDKLNRAKEKKDFAKASTFEVELLRKNGGSVWAEVTASLLFDKLGEPIGVLGMARNITERLRAEKERQRLLESLARSKKMEALGTLAGGVAHDLNNVLSGIVSYPDLLLMDLPDNNHKLRQPIELIRDSGKKAAAIVQDLLTLARRGVPTEDIVNLNDLVAEYLISPEYQRLKSFHPLVEVETQLAPELLNIMGSSIHLAKTIMNLVSNAAEAMPNGGKVLISTENHYLEHSSGGREIQEGDYAFLRVSDTGVGIPPEDLHRIFEPFFTKKKMGRSGTGLGMAVVWGTVEDHHGHIDVQSAEGSGTQVTILLPATRAEARAVKLSNSLDTYKGNGQTVLVVDDLKEQREIAEQIIVQLGYSVKTAESGEEAVEILKHEKADLLILDMIMDPGMDGLETYHQVKKTHPSQKAIITSGYAETERVKTAQRMGVGGYLKKPYTVYNLAAAIKIELTRK